MAPKSEDPEWTPLTPEAKAPPKRRTTRGSAGKAKQGVGARMRRGGSEPSKAKAKAKANAALCVLQSANISKNRRGMRKRTCLNKLVELSRGIPGRGPGISSVLSLCWTKKRRSNTVKRRNLKLSSAFVAALVRVDGIIDEGEVTGDVLTDYSAEKIIVLQPFLKVYERRCKSRRPLVSDNQHSVVNLDEPTAVVAARSMDDCVVILEAQAEPTEPTAARSMDDCVMILEAQAEPAEPTAARSMDDCVVILETQVEPTEPTMDDCVVILETQAKPTEPTAARSMDDCPTAAASSMDESCELNGDVILETQAEPSTVDIEPSVVDDNHESEGIVKPSAVDSLDSPLAVDNHKSEGEGIGEPSYVDNLGSGGTREDELSEVDVIPLTPEVGDSKKDDGTGASNGLNRFVSDITTGGQGESLIDILKKRSEGGLESTPRKRKKRKKMKRHNPKVVDPNHNPSVSTPPTPKTPKTPKLARETRKKVAPPKPDPTCTRRRNPRRKLEFDEECSAMETRDGLFELKLKRRRRKMRRRPSLTKLKALITLTLERLKGRSKGECRYATSQLDGKALRVESMQVAETNTKIQQESVFLIQDEALFEAMADFLTKKMKSLSIVGDGKSNQLVVRVTNTVVLSRNKKYRAKDKEKEDKPVVELDRETDLIWTQFMASNWSEAAEREALGNDEYEYMKGQRKLFRERFEMLNHRMGVVHGSRKFKAWKGSVLDSIIGVFLTQNVSDHFSSSAFMTLASRYPPLSLSEQNAIYCREDRVMLVEPLDTTSELHKAISTPIQEVQQVMSVESPDTTGDATKANGGKKRKREKKEKGVVDWDLLRKQYYQGISRERTELNADSVNWQAVSQASEEEFAAVIVDRGMNNQLAKRIKGFFNRMIKDHGSLDLEWLRHVPPLKAKDYLMSISGLAVKSTECVRLLGLHFPAFPVDTNAGRFFVRMGWVPLKPLPEDVQLHLLNQYPVLESIQKYMWPRLCDNEHPLLYESHCHSITIAKSFCTKTKPNCNECPMRDKCNHFASAHASAKLRLEGSQSKKGDDPSTVSSREGSMLTCSDKSGGDSSTPNQKEPTITIVYGDESTNHYTSHHSKPIIEYPPSPEPEPTEPLDEDIEDIGCNSEPLDDDIEDIGRNSEVTGMRWNGREFSTNLNRYVSEDDLRVVASSIPNLGSIPIPKEKIAIDLRTIHLVYELPDSHPLLEKFDKRELEDPCPYHLVIWKTVDETASSEEAGTMCTSGEVVRYHNYGTVKGTILIPCLTANRGAFPLNGTYFQPHEVFADHETSRRPIDVPREWIWNLRKRFLYCGTSLASICKGMSLEEATYSFNRSIICVRGFDKKTRAPKMLSNKLHYCKSRPAHKCQ